MAQQNEMTKVVTNDKVENRTGVCKKYRLLGRSVTVVKDPKPVTNDETEKENDSKVKRTAKKVGKIVLGVGLAVGAFVAGGKILNRGDADTEDCTDCDDFASGIDYIEVDLVEPDDV